MQRPNIKPLEIIGQGIVAGAAGGLAEIAWVTLYAGATGADAAVLARGVTTAVGVTSILPASPVAAGIAVHMTLAVALGIGLAFARATLRERRRDLTNPFAFMLTALVGVWALNFFVVLPIVSPAFVHIVPYAVSLASKALFGIAAAAAIQWQARSTSVPYERLRLPKTMA